MLSSVDESHGTDVDRNELSNRKVDKIEREVVQFSSEFGMRYRVLKVALKDASELTKNDLEPRKWAVYLTNSKTR